MVTLVYIYYLNEGSVSITKAQSSFEKTSCLLGSACHILQLGLGSLCGVCKPIGSACNYVTVYAENNYSDAGKIEIQAILIFTELCLLAMWIFHFKTTKSLHSDCNDALKVAFSVTIHSAHFASPTTVWV